MGYQIIVEDYMKRLMPGIVVVALVVILSGCGGLLGAPSPGLSGDWEPLSVNRDGHFRNEQVYESPWSSQTYGADGTVTVVNYSLEEDGEDLDGDGTPGEGRVETRRIQGTYTYDPDIPEVTWMWDSRTEAGSTESDLNWTETRRQLFTSNGIITAYAQSDDNENEYVHTRVFTDRDDEGNVTYHDEGRDTFTIDIENGTVSVKETYSQGNTIEAAGVIEEDETTIEEVSTFPNGESWSRGSTVTFSGVETTDRSRSRASADETFSAWSDEGLNFQSYTFVNYGSFMTWLPSSASQSIGSPESAQ